MPLPFDFEDLVGVGVADVLRRAGLFFGSVALASALAGLGLAVGETVADGVDFGRFGDAVGRILWLMLAPILSGWAVFYVPLVIAAGLYFAKAEEPDSRAFVITVLLLGILIVLAAPRPDWFAPTFYGMPLPGGVADPDKAALIWRSVGGGVLLGCGGALLLLARLLHAKSEAASELHLTGIAIENQRKRDELREAYGTDIADRDYVVDDE